MKFSIITMKIIFLLALQQQTFGKGQYSSPQTDIEMPSVVMRWKKTAAAIKYGFEKMARNMLPSVFQIMVSSNISSSCSNDLKEFVKGLSEQKLWAFKMLDSSGKLPNGLLSGSLTSFGDFDTCIETEVPSRKFKGKYCLLEFSLPLPKQRFSWLDEETAKLVNAMEPGTLAQEIATDMQFLYSNQITTSTCLPSSCSADEVKFIVQQVLEFLDFGFEVDVLYCEIKEDHTSFSSGEISIIILFCTLICLVIIGTIIEVSHELKSEESLPSNELKPAVKGLPLKCILCFSAYGNLSRLLKTDQSPDTLTVFHGLRVMSMFWVILCHTFFTVNFRAHDGLRHQKDLPQRFWFQLLNNGFLAVETFFYMSSVLVAYICMRMRVKMNVPLFFFKRYLRLTPSLMLVVALFSIAGQFGSGPLWRETVINKISNSCKKRGWWTLLYVNNYFYSTDTCMGWTWYLAADTHLFLISLYAIIILKRNAKKGFLAIGFLLIVGVLGTAFSHVYYNLPPLYLKSINFNDWYYFGSRAYTPSHIHLPVCCIGLIVGYILATKKVHLPKLINVIGWITSLTMMFAVVFVIYYWNQGHVPGVFVSALYGSTHRVIWTLGLAFITISCTCGQGGIVSRFLSWEAFVPLGRLTYMAYLIHYGIVYLYVGSTRSTMTFNNRTMFFLYLGVVVVTFGSSCVLSLIFESPFMRLEKVLSNGLMEKSIHPVKAVNGTEKSTKESA